MGNERAAAAISDENHRRHLKAGQQRCALLAESEALKSLQATLRLPALDGDGRGRKNQPAQAGSPFTTSTLPSGVQSQSFAALGPATNAARPGLYERAFIPNCAPANSVAPSPIKAINGRPRSCVADKYGQDYSPPPPPPVSPPSSRNAHGSHGRAIRSRVTASATPQRTNPGSRQGSSRSTKLIWSARWPSDGRRPA